MKTFKIFSYAAISFSLLCLSCEQVFIGGSPGTKPTDIFNQVWNFANERYSFFAYKKIDWNTEKAKYAARISDSMTEEELFKVCADMLNLLQDGHVNLISKFDVSRPSKVFSDFPTNYSGEILERTYFKGNTQILDQTFRLYDFGDVLYVYYGDFTTSVSDYAMDYLHKLLQSKKSLILDMRNNGGGSIANIDKIGGRLVNKKTYVGLDLTKAGAAYESFHQDSIFLDTAKTTKRFAEKKVLMLTNRNSYSATNRMAMILKELPNCTLIGGKTGGGGGFPSTTQLSNGWTVRVSASRMLDPSGFNVENGVFPDIEVNFPAFGTANSRDPILDRALIEARK
jgi:hypothetical protein